MTRIAFVLNGCGHRDGSEIHEAVVAMLALEEAGAVVLPVAPNKPQVKLLSHVDGKPLVGSRNMFEESARIARGKIRDIAAVKIEEFDAVVIPGGNGTAYNLCDFADKGASMTVEPGLAALLKAAHEAGKPIGAICIAPVILAKLFGSQGAEITIGNDSEVAAKLRKLGAKHTDCSVSDCVIDRKNKLVTTPAYMLGETVRDIAPGIRKLAQAIVRMCEEA